MEKAKMAIGNKAMCKWSEAGDVFTMLWKEYLPVGRLPVALLHVAPPCSWSVRSVVVHKHFRSENWTQLERAHVALAGRFVKRRCESFFNAKHTCESAKSGYSQKFFDSNFVTQNLHDAKRWKVWNSRWTRRNGWCRSHFKESLNGRKAFAVKTFAWIISKPLSTDL